jgi:chromosome partitioning protein
MVNHKGGVGKTTSTLNLGKALSLYGKKVLLIDIDPQANLSQSSGVEDPQVSLYNAMCDNVALPIVNIGTNLDLVPADLELSEAELRLQADVNGYFILKKILKNVHSKYDYVLIDCPPSLGILTLNALIASNSVMVIVQSEYLAVKGLQTIFNLIDRLKENLNAELEILGMLITQLNPTVFRKSIAKTVRDMYPKYVLNAVIHQNITLAEASSTGKDIFTYDATCQGAKDYDTLAKEVLSK